MRYLHRRFGGADDAAIADNLGGFAVGIGPALDAHQIEHVTLIDAVPVPVTRRLLLRLPALLPADVQLYERERAKKIS
jgi:hypothetical protein